MKTLRTLPGNEAWPNWVIPCRCSWRPLRLQKDTCRSEKRSRQEEKAPTQPAIARGGSEICKTNRTAAFSIYNSIPLAADTFAGERKIYVLESPGRDLVLCRLVLFDEFLDLAKTVEESCLSFSKAIVL